MPGLALVPPNDFIATDFALLPAPAPPADRPTSLASSGAAGIVSLWHKPDLEFRTPRATLLLKFGSSGMGGSISSSVLCLMGFFFGSFCWGLIASVFGGTYLAAAG